ncbi:MAG: hypothetical protein U0M06_13650 [Clostridia bacterium]|nr:hypothetical protein [Clostridia bacterium]
MKRTKKTRAAVTEVSAAPKKKPNIARIVLLFVITAAVFSFYRYMLTTPYFVVVLVTYMALFALLLISYVVYNRGFSRSGITAEMLPDSMTAEEKEEYIGDALSRKERSKWMLLFIFPFVFTFGFDLVSFFITDTLLSTFLKG